MLNKEEYYSLIQKEVLTEEEQEKILNFEDYIRRAKMYQSFLNESAIENLKRFDRFYQEAMNFPHLSQNFQDGIERYQKMETIPMQIEKPISLKRTLPENRAGYTNGIALIFVVLNLGMFLACLLLLAS